MGLIRHAKSRLVSRGSKPRRVRAGIYKGLVLDLDLQHDTQVYLGLWERETYPYHRRAATRCDWVVDVGAGRGELCLFYLQRSTARLVYAFEPDLSELDRLPKNATRNPAPSEKRLVTHNHFVGAVNDEHTVRLDDLDIPRSKPGFIKVDVEGAEAEVLQGGDSLLGHCRLDLLVETHSLELERACVDHLSSRGFRTKIIDKAWWRVVIPELRPIPHNRWLWASNID